MGWGEKIAGVEIRRRCQAGMTLIEVLVGASLLAGILTAAVLFSRNSGSANILGRDLAGASALLGSFVEEARTLDFSAVDSNREYTEETEGCTITWIVYDASAPDPYGQPEGLLLLNARLAWTRFGRPHAIETSTLIAAE